MTQNGTIILPPNWQDDPDWTLVHDIAVNADMELLIESSMNYTPAL